MGGVWEALKGAFSAGKKEAAAQEHGAQELPPIAVEELPLSCVKNRL